MSYPKNFRIQADRTPSVDAFNRWRVSGLETAFESKRHLTAQTLLWADAETSGSGTSSAFSANEAATTLSVGATTAGVRTNQTKQRFNYQAGKSIKIDCTFSEFDTATGITKRVGYFDANNGIFLESAEGTVRLVRRSYVTGSAVDSVVNQSAWDDPLDGTGASGVTIDWTKTQIMVIDLQWLGVGSVRLSFVVNGTAVAAHELHHANSLATVYMSTPNLPVRYEIENDGTGLADDFVAICSDVSIEGTQNQTGLQFLARTASAISCATAGTIYPLLAIRLKSARVGTVVDLTKVSILETTGDNYLWSLYFNPTVTGGSFSFSSVNAESSVEYALGNGTLVITGGTGVEFDGGFISNSNQRTAGIVNQAINNALRLGVDLAGALDEIVLAYTPLAASSSVYALMQWNELS